MKCQKNVKRRQEKLLAMLTFTAFLFLLVFVFAAGPVYAPPPQPDRPIDPGGGPPPSTIDGYIIDPTTGQYVSGMPVYLYVNKFIMLETLTSVSGYFSFHHDGIYPWSDYKLTVNGRDDWGELGNSLRVASYCQMAMTAHTDNIGYARMLLHLQPVTEEGITAAALFSNTKYATLDYEEIESRTVNHHLSFSVEAGLSYSLGYSIDDDAATYAIDFQCDPLQAISLQKHYRIASYYDGSSSVPGIKKTGITERVENHLFSLRIVQEYLSHDDPQVYSNLAYFDCERVPPFTIRYEETGSYTWTQESGLALSYSHFGVNLNVETTITTTSTNKVETTINRYVDNNTAIIVFGMYTAGYRLENPENPAGKGGLELHIWDISGGVG